MTERTGVARLRQAIENQRALGNSWLLLSNDDAEELADEIDAEFLGICGSAEREIGRYAWAHGVPAPMDADGEVVPLDTRVMYTHRGKRIELTEFDLLHSVLSGGFVWRAIRNTGHGVEDLKLDFLHLRRPDSWERLEEDVKRYEFMRTCCSYYNRSDVECPECPANGRGCGGYRIAWDVLHRAKALAGLDSKGFAPQPSPHGPKEGDVSIDEKRREVAENLHSEAEDWSARYGDDTAYEMSDHAFTESVLDAFGFDDMEMDAYRIFEKIADLIDPEVGDE